MALHVVVVGAGIVGAACAVELVREGYEVTLVDPAEPGGEQAASYGNAGWISPASVVPMSTPGLWKRLPGFLLDPAGPVVLRWHHVPKLLPWLGRFLLAGSTVARVEAISSALAALLHDAPARHAALAAETGAPELVRRDGLLYVYPDRQAFAGDALSWRLRRDNGVVWQELDADELRRCEPDLDPRYTFAVLVPAGAHCRDPGGYARALVEHACGRGAVLRRASAVGFDCRDGRLRSVVTDAGAIACDRAVIAAGIHSGRLAREVGDAIPLASERGYHVVVADPAAGPRRPSMPSDGRMGNTMTIAGLRAAGQVELASLSAPPDWRRADILLTRLLAAYPALGRDLPESRVDRWMGHRPSTPDGLPVIGCSRLCADVVEAFGHGHVGLATAPVTGRIVTDLIAGRSPVVPMRPYSPRRFSLRR